MDWGHEAAILTLLFARIGAVSMLLPLFGEEAVPGRIRLLLALGLTVALAGLLRPEVAAAAARGNELPHLLLLELVKGLALGSLIRTLFQAAAMAGSLISVQTGFSSALLFDPALGGQVPVLAKWMALGAALACLATGVHQLWLAALVKSYALFPVGGGLGAGPWADLAMRTVGEATALALAMAAPFLLFGILFNVALGLAARLAPGIPIFFIAQPLSLLLGLGLLSLTLGAMLSLFAQGMDQWLRSGLG